MEVVRHQTIGVQSEGMAGRASEQEIEDALRRGWYEEMGNAVVTTDGDEISSAAEVVSPRETCASTVDRHTEG
jgi:hypothetical protein